MRVFGLLHRACLWYVSTHTPMQTEETAEHYRTYCQMAPQTAAPIEPAPVFDSLVHATAA